MFEIPSVRNGQLGFGLVYSVWVKMYVFIKNHYIIYHTHN